MKTIKYIAILTMTLFIFSDVWAQTTTGEAGIVKADNAEKGVFIVPFQTKMYQSDINKEISEKTKLNNSQIAEAFRSALDQNLHIALSKRMQPVSLYQQPIEPARKEFAYIYSSIGYKYVPVPQEENVAETKAKKSWNKLKEKLQEKNDSPQNNEPEKYMQTKITNPNLLTVLKKTYNTDYTLFVNELDIKRAVGETSQGNAYANNRELVVHYTIFDKSGNIVKTGVAKSYFNKNINTIEGIIKHNFSAIAEYIATKFFETIYPPAEQER